MTLEEFGQNVADCEVLTDKEARYLLMLYSGAKPSKTLQFKGENRTGNWELLEFKANSVSLVNQGHAACNLRITNANCEIQISELHFCQPDEAAGIDSVELQNFSIELQGRIAKSVVKLQNQTFKNYPVYKASFEEPFKFQPQYCTPQILFRKRSQAYQRQVAILVGSTINHSFNVNGKQIQVSLTGYNNRAWYCLVAVKMKCVT